MKTDYMNFPNEVKINQIILEKLRVSMAQQISKYDLNFAFKVDSYLDHVTQNMVYKMNIDILGEHHNLPIHAPETWFQHFKQEYFPKWLLKKYPVKHKKLGTLELYQLYPHIKANIPDERHYIHYVGFKNVEPEGKKNGTRKRKSKV